METPNQKPAEQSVSVNRITEGVIWKQLLLFFFPIVLGTFFQQLYNTADAVIVGRFIGKEALACVGGSANQIANLLVGFFIGLSSGATVIISQYYGAYDTENLDHALHTAIAFSLVGGVFLTVLGYFSTPFLLRMMQTPDDLMAGSTTYLRIYFLGVIFVFVYNVGSGILRAAGDSRRPLYYLVVCCIINIVLDLVFVVVFKWGIAGAAAATAIANGVSAVLTFVTLLRSQDLYRLVIKKIRFYSVPLGGMIKIGIPAGLQSMMYNVSNVIIQTSLNKLGTDTVAAWTAFGKMDSFYWMVVSAFGITIMTFVGQNFGAKKYSRMNKSVKICLSMTFGFSVIMSIFFMTVSKYIYYLFTTDPGVIEIGLKIVLYMAPAYALYSFIEIYSGALRGIGDVFIPMIMTCGGICVFRVIWILFVTPYYPGVESIVISYPISWALTAVLFIFYYRKKQRQIGN